MTLKDCKEFIGNHERFHLAAHTSPDGDTLGSCLALRLALLVLNKEVTVVCEDPVPDYLMFLPGADSVRTSPETNLEAVIYIDCAEHSRTGKNCARFEKAPYQFCIDHHETNPRLSKDGDWVEETAATAEMIYRLISTLGIPISRDIAECIFTGISTDTGNFSYSNTKPETFRIVSELLPSGIDLQDLNRRLFRSMSLPKARLIAYTLGSACIYSDGSVSLASVSIQTLNELGAKESDCEGLIDYLRDIDTVEIACLLRESKDGTVKGSLRSKRGANVLEIACCFQGGGHQKAAGFTLQTDLAEAGKRVLPIILETVEKWKESYLS